MRPNRVPSGGNAARCNWDMVVWSFLQVIPACAYNTACRILFYPHTINLVTAGIILIAAESSGVPFDSVDKDQQRWAAWDKCLQTLHRMGDMHPSARDYVLALSGLMQRHRSMSCTSCLCMYTDAGVIHNSQRKQPSP